MCTGVLREYNGAIVLSNDSELRILSKLRKTRYYSSPSLYFKSCQAQFKVLVVFPKMRLAQNIQMTPGMDLAETEDVLLAILLAFLITVEDRGLSLKIPYIEVQSLNPARW